MRRAAPLDSHPLAHVVVAHPLDCSAASLQLRLLRRRRALHSIGNRVLCCWCSLVTPPQRAMGYKENAGRYSPKGMTLNLFSLCVFVTPV